MILIAIIGLLVSVFLACAEAAYERDWPRDTFKYVLAFIVVLILVFAH